MKVKRKMRQRVNASREAARIDYGPVRVSVHLENESAARTKTMPFETTENVWADLADAFGVPADSIVGYRVGLGYWEYRKREVSYGVYGRRY